MLRGSACGADRGPRRLSIGMFVRDDGGYTSVAVALALLLSISLVFTTAAAGWAQARSAEVQEVADAAAMAGSNCVAAFATIAQVLDACVLSLGIVGVLVYGAGLVVSAIPVIRTQAPPILEVGRKVLSARRTFAHSAAEGLRRLEGVLPALIVANSASCVSANCRGGMSYVGCAVPLPATSESDFSSLESDVEEEKMDDVAEELQEAAEQKDEALKRAKAAKERAWRADCVDDPHCLRSRAYDLAGLSGPQNPDYSSPEEWRFGYALIRARNYYARRMAIESPASGYIDELTRSEARWRFFEYAYDVLYEAVCEEGEEHVHIELPELPHTSGMVRECRLYWQIVWPCSSEEEGRTLHSCTACPGFTGGYAGLASLADLEAGGVRYCDTCGMSVEVMGNVADASTNISNGFEHYWRIIVNESKAYQEAMDDVAEAEERLRQAGEDSSDAFQEAIDALKIERPKLRPAGAWGCVSIVARRGSVSIPTELTSAFISGASLPSGVALSAATLAPDDATDGNTVLSRVLDGVGSSSGPAGIISNITDLWGRLLVGYGSSYDYVSGVADDLFDDIGSLFGEKVATWLKGKLSAIVEVTGFEPADMRMRKPVLVYSQQVLDKAGYSNVGKARELVEALPASQEELTETNWSRVVSALGIGEVTIAELPIPGVDGMTIPLTINVEELLEAA